MCYSKCFAQMLTQMHSLKHILLDTPCSIRPARRDSRRSFSIGSRLRWTCRRTLANTKSKHLSLIRFEHFKAMAFEIDRISRRGDFPKHVAQQSSNRRDRFVGFFAELHAEQFFNIAYAHAAAQNQAAIGFAHHVGSGIRSVAAAFPNDFFDEIFDGREPSDES